MLNLTDDLTALSECAWTVWWPGAPSSQPSTDAASEILEAIVCQCAVECLSLILALADTCRTTSISSHPGRALVPEPSHAKVDSIIERTAIYNTTSALRLHLPVIVTLFCRLDSTPSPVFCMSGDAVRSPQNPDYWPTSHTTAARLLVSPLTAQLRVFTSPLRQPIRSRQQRSVHDHRPRGARAVLLFRESSKIYCATHSWSYVPRVRTDVAAPFSCRLPAHLNIATPRPAYHAAVDHSHRKPIAGALRRSSGRPLCRTRAPTITCTLRACATETLSPPLCRHQSPSLQSATSPRGGGSLARSPRRRKTRKVRPLLRSMATRRMPEVQRSQLPRRT